MIHVNLPHPPARLHPNEKPGWQERHRLTSKARGLAKVLALSALNGQPRPWWAQATIKASWYFETNRRRDWANLQGWLKAYVDGLVDAEIIQDDNTDCLIWLPCEIGGLSRPPCVILTVQPIIQCNRPPHHPSQATSASAATSASPTSTAGRRKP